MPSLSETFARLAAARPINVPIDLSQPLTGMDRLSDLTAFGNDPGNLRARYYIPNGMRAGAPLVVVLHGCTQNAAGYDHGAGWSALADRDGFALLFPEQRTANNANRCFNWFIAEDIARDHGEAASITQMVRQMIATHQLDPERVFVTGLSAGGAMTMVLLATYPELFAGGAVIAGLPYGTAANVNGAMQRMRGIGLPSAELLADRLRAAAPAPARWPTLAVWHGTADQTVAPANMDAIVAGWATVQGLAFDAATSDRIDGQQRRRWTGPDGRIAIEAYSIAGLGHGTPIDPTGPGGCGAAMPFMLPAGINSTRLIAQSWGIAVPAAVSAEPPRHAPDLLPPRKAARPAAGGVNRLIEDALRAAGLMC